MCSESADELNESLSDNTYYITTANTTERRTISFENLHDTSVFSFFLFLLDIWG